MNVFACLGSLILVLALAFAPPPALAGKLDDFETEATEGDGDGGGGDSDDVYVDGEDDAYFAAALFALLVPVYGATKSWDSVGSRAPGEATLAFARVDAAYQLVESDVDAGDLRGELGYGPFALQARETHYDEDQPRDSLDLIQAHALLRMLFLPMLEVDLGLGAIVLDGDGTETGFSGTVPVLIHPWDFLGLEFRPAWAAVNDSTVSDYDLSLLAGWRFISARAGYRWTDSGDETLNGPIFGLAARW